MIWQPLLGSNEPKDGIRFAPTSSSCKLRLCALAATLLFFGCVPKLHKPPKKGAPAAIVKLRVSHDHNPSSVLMGALSSSPPSLRSMLTIDGRRLPYSPRNGGVVATWTRVKPGWRRYEIRSWFTQRYQVYEREAYYVTRYETCSKNVCRTEYSGGKSRYRCRYRTTTCRKRYRRYRNVLRWRTKTLARCSAKLTVFMRKGANYLLTYNYSGPSACTIACHRQHFISGERFVLRPCRHTRP